MTAAASPNEGIVDRDEILRLVRTAWRPSGEWMLTFCPAHPDGQKHNGKGGQSLGLSTRGVLRCFAGCAFGDVMAAIRPANVASLNGARVPAKPEPRHLVRIYQYKDAGGERVVAEKGRFETASGHKTFLWRLPGEERWTGGVSVADMPLYGVWLLANAPDAPIYYVEGEKAAEACWGQGLIAVSCAGGAATKDFGGALDALRDRDVLLWPDNDASGRTYMNLVQARLLNLARTLRFVTVSVPEKGDAFDYFEAGGRVEDLEEASPDDPAVDILGSAAVRIRVPTSTGPVAVTFTEMEKSARSLDARVEITGFNLPGRPYAQRLNLLSASARTQLRRELESIWGNAVPWASVLNTATNMAEETYLRQERGVDVFDVPEPMRERFLVDPLIPLDAVTVLFGDGSSAKTYFMEWLALCLSLGYPAGGLRLSGAPPALLIDYEDSATNAKRRLRRLMGGLNPVDDEPPAERFHYWPAHGIPFADQVDAIKAYCERKGIGWIIVDSAAPACGGPPEDSQYALGLFQAVRKIGLTAVIVAHVNRAADTMKPFGSVFWHNEARRTWYIERVQEEDSDEIDLGLYCRKVNDGRRPSPMGFRMTFEGLEGPVTLTPRNVNEVPELLEKTTPKNRIRAALRAGALTRTELAQRTGLRAGAIESTIRRAGREFLICGKKGKANLYGLAYQGGEGGESDGVSYQTGLTD